MSNAGAMVWATRTADGTAVHITEVKSGLACECVCPGCRAALEAVNSENPFWKRRPHFRHYEAPELDDCSTAAVIASAKATIAEIEDFLLPDLTVEGQATSHAGKVFIEVLCEPGRAERVTGYEFVDATDAVLTLADGQQIYVRLIATGIDTNELQPKQSVLAEVVIDISDPVLRTADRNMLRQHIALSPNGRTWCQHQRRQVLQARADDLAGQKAAEHWAARIVPNSQPNERAALPPHFRQATKTTKPTPRPQRVNWEPISYEWSTGPLPVERSAGVRRARSFYHDGAYRLYAPRIDYDRVLRDAEQARNTGCALDEQLEAWRTTYNLVDDLKPILAVLSAAGIVRPVYGDD